MTATLDGTETAETDATAGVAAREPRAARLLALACIALVILPIVVATVRGIDHGWLPIGDNAFFALRARDVFTAHHPLVGTWTSASTSVGVDINNPGPLYFDLLALPVKINGAAGLAVGVALINALSVLGIAIVARRRAGALGTAAAMLMAGGLVWTMGSELLYDPWQPNSLLLPFLLLLTLAWGAAQGDLAALPWLVGVASFVVQTHFSYALLVLLVAIATVAASGIGLLHRRRVDPEGWPRQRRRAVVAAAASGVVAFVCWLQPLIDQFDGHGNLLKLVTHAGGSAKTIGADLGTRLVASILALPPFWGRPSFEKGLVLVGGPRPPALAVAAVALLALGLVLVLALVVAVRRRDAVAGVASGLSLLTVAGSLLTAAIIPVGAFALAPHQLRWLWPIAAFTTFALVLTLARVAGRRVALTARCGALTLAVAALALLTLPTYNPKTGPTADAASIPAARRLVAQLSPLEGRGPVLFDVKGLRFAEPYSVVVMADLQRRGIEFRVDEPGWIHQLGLSRAADGTEKGTIVQRDREQAFEAPPGGELIARVEGLTGPERDELAALRREVATYVESKGLRLDDRGREAVALGALKEFGPPDQVRRQPEPFIGGDDFVVLVRRDLAPIDPAWRGRVERYVDLLERWQKQTVAIFWVPAS